MHALLLMRMMRHFHYDPMNTSMFGAEGYRRPSRTPIGLGRSVPRFGGSGPCIVKVEQQLSFCIVGKWIYFKTFFIIKLFLLFLLRRGDCGNYCGSSLQFSASEERRHTLQIGVSIGVPGPIVLLSVLYGTLLMVIRQHSV
jgi:hypothetical protein